MKVAPAPLRAWLNPALTPTGCIGAPPANVDPLRAIADAEAWLRAQGCDAARGPLDGATWFAYRASLGPDDRPPFPGEPSAAPQPWRDAGYAVCQTYMSLLVDNGPQIAATRSRDRDLRAAGWTLETLEALGDFDAALDLFYALSQAAFAQNYAYSPIDRQTFGALYAPLQPMLRPEFVLLARSPTGEPAGLCVSYPDVQNPGLKQLIVKTLAVHPDHRGAGLGSWMVGETHRKADAAGLIGGGIHALMRDGNRSQQISRQKGTIVRRYALFERRL
ncbi:MAG: GNAT family N-acetyltransferase [Myxococcota bacterium]